MSDFIFNKNYFAHSTHIANWQGTHVSIKCTPAASNCILQLGSVHPGKGIVGEEGH